MAQHLGSADLPMASSICLRKYPHFSSAFEGINKPVVVCGLVCICSIQGAMEGARAGTYFSIHWFGSSLLLYPVFRCV